uniref:Uncharacterized protein n=1 Tax=Arundo donax TaxID=35708 RepID=A0A0A9N3Y9_ARUDO
MIATSLIQRLCIRNTIYLYNLPSFMSNTPSNFIIIYYSNKILYNLYPFNIKSSYKNYHAR